MRADEFVTHVQLEANCASYNEAYNLTKAVIETLGERLYKTERNKLAAELPKELKEFLMQKKQDLESSRENMNRFWVQEFYNRVSNRAEISYEKAVRQTKAVISIMSEAVSEGVLKEVLDSLPKEYIKIFKVKAEVAV
jgi:uncharacterized protein (DUF2267 family)